MHHIRLDALRISLSLDGDAHLTMDAHRVKSSDEERALSAQSDLEIAFGGGSFAMSYNKFQ